MQYTREGFRDKASSVVPSSKEATRAIRDAEEQLERMNYYHSIREAKERGDESPAKSGHVNTTVGTGERIISNADTYVHETSPQTQSDAIKSDDPLRTEKRAVVEAWILGALPELHPDDTASYTLRLLEDGFDSLSLLQTDLILEDLDFMKMAHQRAITRAYSIKSS